MDSFTKAGAEGWAQLIGPKYPCGQSKRETSPSVYVVGAREDFSACVRTLSRRRVKVVPGPEVVAGWWRPNSGRERKLARVSPRGSSFMIYHPEI